MDLSRKKCKLCGHACGFLCAVKRRPFYICKSCELIFVSDLFYVTKKEERARYDLHENTVGNYGYVVYLSQVVDVVKTAFSPDSKILDFGCGENAVLGKLLNDAGYDCASYDPLYFRHSKTLLDNDGQFDIIILCEVAEHLRDMPADFLQIKNLLRSGGVVIIRTQLYEDLEKFPKWWYAQDPTHINFFSEKSLKQLADVMRMENVVKTKYHDIFILK